MLNAIRWPSTASKATGSMRRKGRARSIVPTIELLERRELLTTGAFLQGTAFLDLNQSGMLDSNESHLSGATVRLFASTDTNHQNPLGTAVTDTNGSYLFTDANVTGGLNPGAYQLVETPPQGFRNQSAQMLSQLDPALVLDNHTIQVTVLDPSSLQLHYNTNDLFNQHRYEIYKITFFNAIGSGSVGQLPFSVTGAGGFSGSLSTFCVDLASDLNLGANNYGVLPSPVPTGADSPHAWGQIAYLFNHYATGLVAMSRIDAAGLQLAMWELEYDNVVDFNSGNFKNLVPQTVAGFDPTTQADLTAALAKANFYISDSQGKSEDAVFLQALGTGSGRQGVIATGSFNFGNLPKTSPAILTSATITSSGVVGAAQLQDTAILSGGNNPTGTITFQLKAPDGTTTTFAPITITAPGPYASPSVTAAEVGTYLWSALYSGDGMNNGAVDNGVNESATTIKASPSVATSANITPGGVVGAALLSDTAIVSGGYSPSGTIVFTLTRPDNTTVTVGTATVNGDGTYESPTALAIRVGVYTWHASYSGDGLNNGAVDNGVNESAMSVKASPSVATSASITPGGVVGAAQLYDTAIVSGGYNPTGAITFTLQAPDGSVVTFAPVPVSGDGTYNAPTVVAAQVGIYTWHASYAGDGLNNGAADNGVNESVTTFQSSPMIATSASITPGGVVGSAQLDDTAIITGGDNPTGTITFTLTAPDGGATTVGTATVNGDGTYHAPSVTATQVGTYTWSASYSGDGLNVAANDNGVNESATSVKASPSIATSASITPGGVVGVAQLYDTAIVSGGYNSTGAITFTLQAPDGSVVTFAPVPVSGDGTYNAPTVVAAQVGIYTWHASYAGDGLNNGAADNGANESVTTVKASPSISTTASAGGTVGFVSVHDTATVTGGYAESGTVTFKLYASDHTSVVYTDANEALIGGIAASANFTPTAPGTYYWVAAYNGDGSNNGVVSGVNNEPVTIIKASPSISTSASESAGGVVGAAVLSDSATISGGYNVSGGSITFTLDQPDGQTITEGTVSVTAAGVYNSPPVTATEVGTYTWHANYTGDGLNNGAIDQGGALEQVTTVQAKPTLATTASFSASHVVGVAIPQDMALLSGGYHESGAITFKLYAPDGAVVDVETITPNGDGTYTTANANVATQLGVYIWTVSYVGDGLNNGAIDQGGALEQVTTIKTSPTLVTNATGDGGVAGFVTLSDSATLSGGYHAGGTITFTLTAPDHTVSTVGSATVSGDGVYNAPTVLATQVGVYTWHASYNGDSLNNSEADDGSNESVTTIAPVTIGDYVWEDTNGNGKQDGGELGIGGVTVNLYAGATLVDTKITNGSGAYLFTETPGAYTVKVDTSTLPAGYAATTVNAAGTTAANDSNPNPSVTNPAVLASGQSDLTMDFGYYKPAALGDYVWLDKNANGVQDAGESGIQGVKVTLYTSTGTPVGNPAMTDANGLYHFTGLTPGSYYVQFTNPGGYVFSPQGAGTTATDSNADFSGKTATITLVSGQTDNSIDAGLYKTATLGDFVWEDKNANGVQDGGETGVAGAVVTLSGPSGPQTYTTLANGFYQFTGLTPGSYTVTVAPPAGFIATLTGQGTTATDSNGSPTTVILASGDNNPTIDFGYYQAATLGDFVWNDANANGVQDTGETGVAGATVKLFTSANVQVSANQMTGANGLYLFTGLTPGDYYVQVTAPAGYLFSPKDTGGNDLKDSDADTATGKMAVTTLTSGEDDRSWDAGLFKVGSISGTKFLDATGNGATGDDAPLAGTKIYIDANNNGLYDNGELYKVTGVDGTYQFNNLTAGTYIVREVVPTGYVRTGPTVVDYYSVTLTAGQNATGYNFTNAEVCDKSILTSYSFLINGCTTVSDLRGNTNQGDLVTATFTVKLPTGVTSHTFTLVSYTAPGASYDANTANQQQIYDSASITVTQNGTYTLTVLNPSCYYQVDFVCGDAIDHFGAAASKIFYSAQNRLFSADNDGVNACSTSLAVVKGDFATTAFWSSANGQTLIKSFNGSAMATQLASWLATTFPNLYGTGTGGHSLVKANGTYLNNTEVAAAYKILTSGCADQQVLAAALSVYATSSYLEGSGAATKAKGYGFHVTLDGSGADYYSVGTNGAAFGVADNAKLAVIQLLKGLNAKTSPGSSASAGASAVFSAINTAGAVAVAAVGSDAATASTGDPLILLNTSEDLRMGTLTVVVDGLTGNLAAAEQARIDDAIASINVTLGEFGVILVEVQGDAGADADIHIHLAKTSVVGGAAQGVLGVTTVGGEITIVTTWDYYLGADLNAIGAGQYDFETVVAHELGHAVGLGHSMDGDSVMFPYLATAQERRQLTASDLSAIRLVEDGSPEPLLAAAFVGKYMPGSNSVTNQAGARLLTGSTIDSLTADLTATAGSRSATATIQLVDPMVTRVDALVLASSAFAVDAYPSEGRVATMAPATAMGGDPQRQGSGWYGISDTTRDVVTMVDRSPDLSSPDAVATAAVHQPGVKLPSLETKHRAEISSTPASLAAAGGSILAAPRAGTATELVLPCDACFALCNNEKSQDSELKSWLPSESVLAGEMAVSAAALALIFSNALEVAAKEDVDRRRRFVLRA